MELVILLVLTIILTFYLGCVFGYRFGNYKHAKTLDEIGEDIDKLIYRNIELQEELRKERQKNVRK